MSHVTNVHVNSGNRQRIQTKMPRPEVFRNHVYRKLSVDEPERTSASEDGAGEPGLEDEELDVASAESDVPQASARLRLRDARDADQHSVLVDVVPAILERPALAVHIVSFTDLQRRQKR